MATITNTEYYPHVGQVWKRAVQLWEVYLQDATLAWSSSLTAVNSKMALTVTLAGPVDTTIYRLSDVNHASGRVYGLDFIFTLPGMMYMPKVLEASYGARVTKTEFGNKISNLRASAIAQWTQGTQIQTGTGSFNVFNPTGEVTWSVQTYRLDFMVVQDAMNLFTVASTVTDTFPGGENPTQGVSRQSVTLAGGSSAPQDNTAIVAALNDIAMIDVSYTANNGGAVWSMRGKVRSP